MMHQIYKSPPAPRYLTIKIKYYPLDKKLVFIPLYLFVVCLFAYGVHYLIFETPEFLKFARFGYAAEETLTIKTHPAEEIAALMPVNELSHTAGHVIFHGSRDKKEIALTFDADMTPGMKRLFDSGSVSSYFDKRIPDYLTQTNTKATFFLSGMWIEVYPEEAKELAENPLFELANHSYSHPGFADNCYGLESIPDSKNMEEMEETQGLLAHVSKRSNTLFRFPGGCYTQTDLESAKEAGLTVIQWDVAGDDGFNNDASAIAHNVIPFVRNGSIIVLHVSGAPNAPKTMDALPQIVDTLKQKGYEFVTVSELFEEKPVSNPTVIPYMSF